MTPEEVAWVAGLLEGEGYFSISSARHRQARVVCSMTDEDVVRKLHVLAGGPDAALLEARTRQALTDTHQEEG